jgi:hypothetical protein
LIHCRTQRTWLNLGEDSFLDWLQDAEGAWIGILHPHDLLFHCFSNPSDTVGEFVEISRGYAFKGDWLTGVDEWMLCEGDSPKSIDRVDHEFINVLWVEWEEGVAYRKGIGRVMKSAWEGLELEWIDLVLG